MVGMPWFLNSFLIRFLGRLLTRFFGQSLRDRKYSFVILLGRKSTEYSITGMEKYSFTALRARRKNTMYYINIPCIKIPYIQNPMYDKPHYSHPNFCLSVRLLSSLPFCLHPTRLIVYSRSFSTFLVRFLVGFWARLLVRSVAGFLDQEI